MAGTGGSAGAPGVAGKGGSGGEGPALPLSPQQAVVAGNNAFAIDLYGQLRQDVANSGKNLLFSPLSLSLALGMTSAGAQGATLAEMSKVMHFTLPQEQLHPALHGLSAELAMRPQEARELAKKNGTPIPDASLNLVNSIWGDQNFTWKTSFLDVLASTYKADLNKANFLANSETERLKINDWVSQQTEKRIEDLLPPEAIDKFTRFVLVNAVSLTFPWWKSFDKKATKPGSFLTPTGTSEVPLMSGTMLPGAYAEDDLAKSGVLHLNGGGLSLVVYVPKEGKFDEFEANLATEISALKAVEKSILLNLKLPRFKYTSPSVKLTPALYKLGMKTPLDKHSADFFGMSDDPAFVENRLFIKDVFHKAMLNIDEDGLEAAAASAVIVNSSEFGPPTRDLEVDRSFFLSIRDNATGTLLFFGRILDPMQP